MGIGFQLWYPIDMVVIVLTGGIGSGKGVASEYFRRRGASVIDLDEVARNLMVSGSPLLASVAKEFGPEVLRADGSLDRGGLARVGFADRESAMRLDALVHPQVERGMASLLEEVASGPTPPRVVVLEVPLLAEAPQFASLGDVVVAISACEATRIDRAVARGMARSDVMRRVAVQAPDAARATLADVVVENDGTLEQLCDALERFWQERIETGAESGVDDG